MVFGLVACKAENNATADTATSEKSEVAASAANGDKPGEDKLTQIQNMFMAARPDLKVKEIQETGIEGISYVVFEGRGAVYLVGDGPHIFTGDMLKLGDGEITNLTEEAKNGPRKELIATVKDEDMIIFKPEGEVKASVVVFTDVDCGYCRKLHDEVPAMNALGIEVKYMAYPRAGIGSNSYAKIASAWCADNPQDALTKLKAGQTIPTNVCEGNPVPQHFNYAMQAGLTGTPAIVLDSGQLIPGYVTAEKLARSLGI